MLTYTNYPIRKLEYLNSRILQEAGDDHLEKIKKNKISVIRN